MYPVAVSISSDLIAYLRDLYVTAFTETVIKNGDSEDLNGFTRHGLPAYIIATSAVEAFINEMFLSPAGRIFFQKVSDDNKYWEWLEKTELPYKLILIPQLLLNRTFATDKQPYQDMKMLIKLRNELIHYKMAFTEPNFMKDLKQKKIALDDVGATWTHNVSSLKGIFWAQVDEQSFYNAWTESFVKEKAKELLEKRKAAG